MEGQIQGWLPSASRSGQKGIWTKRQCIDRISEGAELLRAEISSPELEGAQGVVGFPVQGLVGFCGKFRDWWLFFTPFSLHPACGLG